MTPCHAILKVKAAVGLLDRMTPSETAADYKQTVGSTNHRAIAREAVRKSLVMLKNEQGVLPLHPAGRYLIAGPGADDIGMQSGGWTISWQGTGNANSDFPGGTSIAAGLRQQIDSAGGQLLTPEEYTEGDPLDAVVYVFGETPYAEGVGGYQISGLAAA